MAPESILNPDEIHDLLKNSGPVSSIGKLWEGECTLYDFRSAALKKDEKIQTVNQIHSQAAKSIETNINKSCGLELTIEFSKHEMVSGADAVAQVSLDKTLMVLWQNPSGGQEGSFLIDRTLFFQMYTKMLGGTRAFTKPGALTLLDQSYLVRILKPVVESLGRLWSGYGNWSFILQEKAVDQEALETLRWSFDCFRAIFTVKGMESEGQMVVVFPREMLNSVGTPDSTEAAGEASNGHRDIYWTKAVWGAISEIALPIQADLGSLQVPLRKVLNLSLGDEFSLVVPKDGYPVALGDHQAFRVSIGTLGDHRAIKVLNKG